MSKLYSNEEFNYTYCHFGLFSTESDSDSLLQQLIDFHRAGQTLYEAVQRNTLCNLCGSMAGEKPG